MKRQLSTLPRTILSTATLVAGAALCHAATWEGGPGNWSDNNWDTPPVSGAATDIVFDGASGGAVANDMPDNPFVLRSLAFATGAGAYSLSGGALDLRGAVQNNSSATQTIANNIALGAGSRWTLANNIVYSGAMTSAGPQFRKEGAGELVMTGDNTLFLENPFVLNGPLRLSGPNARLVVKNDLIVFNTEKIEKSLTLENGARLEMATAIWENSFGRHGKYLLTGAGTTWLANNGRINSFDGLQFTITDGAVFTNCFEMYMWVNGTPGNHNVSITKGAQVHTDLFSFAGNNNTAFVGGAKNNAPALLRAHGSAGLGYGAWGVNSPTSNSSITIGTDGVLVFGAFLVGCNGDNNAILAEDGGRMERIGENGYFIIGGAENKTSNSRLEVRGRNPVTQEPSFLNLGGGTLRIEADNPAITDSPQSTAATAFTNSMFVVADGAIATNLTILAGNYEWENGQYIIERIGRETHCKVVVTNGGKVYANRVVIGEQSSATLLSVEGADSLLDLAKGSLNIGISRNARDNRVVVNAASVTNAGNIFLGYHRDSGTFVGGNSMRIENGGSLSSNGECIIGSDSWWGNVSPQTNAFNSVVITGAESTWHHTGESVRIGYAEGVNTTAYGNSVKVEDGGLLRADGGIRVGRGASASFDNRLILGAGGSVVTPYVNVGYDGAVNNAIVFAGGSITANDLNVRQHNGFIVEASRAEFEPSVFGYVTLGQNTWVKPVLAESGIGARTYVLIKGNISGYANLQLDADPSLWQLNASATEISLTKKQVGSLLMVK